jgi:hypothetical protein
MPDPFSVSVPRIVAPSLKVAVPLTVPTPPPVAPTVAVKVTDCADMEGLIDEVTEVAVGDLFTVCVSTGDTLTAKFVLPPYSAVIECELSDNAAVAKVATPDPFSVPVPSVAVPSLNVTVPLAVAAPPPVALTVAANVTDCPQTDGLTDEVTVVAVAD